jgi:hypothetical protein
LELAGGRIAISLWRLSQLELLLLLVKLQRALVILEDGGVQVLLELLSVLSVHDYSVLRLSYLLLRLHSQGVLLLLSESVGRNDLLRVNEAHPMRSVASV